MAEPPVSQSDTVSLDSLTLALVVSGMGVCTDEAVADLRRYVESKAIAHTSVEFDASLERAKRYFAQGDAHFFLCDGEPCQQRRRFEATSNVLQYEAERIGCLISPTACQGPCKQAPVALLRVGHGCELFAQFVHRREWEAVLDFAQRAAQAKTLPSMPGRRSRSDSIPSMNRKSPAQRSNTSGSCWDISKERWSCPWSNDPSKKRLSEVGRPAGAF